MKMKKILVLVFGLLLIIACPLVSKNDVSKELLENLVNGDIGKSAYASSYLTAEGKPDNYYDPERAIDEDRSTAWVPSGKKDGIGEYIIFNLTGGEKDFPVELEISIINGYAKSEALFKANNRVKKAVLEIYEAQIIYGLDKIRLAQDQILNTRVELDFEDTMEPQSFRFTVDNKLEATSDRFTFFGKLIIKEVYSGEKYNDTCISEIVTNWHGGSL